MYIDASTIIAIAGAITAITTIGGVLFENVHISY